MAPPTLSRVVRRLLLRWMLLPSLAFCFGFAVFLALHEIESLKGESRIISGALGRDASGYLTGAAREMRHLGLLLRGLAPDEISHRLRQYQESEPRFSRIVITGGDRRILASSRPEKPGLDLPHIFPPGSDAHLSTPIYSNESGQPVVFVRDVAPDGLTVVGALNLGNLRDALTGLAANLPDLRIILTDGYGNCVVHPDMSQVRTQANLGDLPLWREAREGGEAFGLLEQGGQLDLAQIRVLPDNGWILAVSRPAMNALWPSLRLLLLLFCLSVVFFGLVLWLVRADLHRRVIEPMRKLIASIQVVARGDYQGELPRTGAVAELTAMEQEFDEMRRLIRERETLLRNSERKYRDIVENAVEGIFQSTPDGKLVSANPATARMLDYASPEELLRSVDDIATQLYADPDGRDALLERLRAEGSVTQFETRLKTKTGRIIWTSLNARAEVDEYGRLRCIEGLIEDVSGRREQDQRLRASLREKEILLKEIHHRVKNNLQVISSLLYLQADAIRDDERARFLLLESRNRIGSMALVHQELYESKDLAYVDLGTYVRKLAGRLVSGLSRATAVNLRVAASDVQVTIHQAIPCGLIVNELVTNALRHAFDGRAEGRLDIRVAREAELVTVEVVDDGVGLSPDFDPRDTETLGMELVVGLTAQLHGRLDCATEKGARFGITFPIDAPTDERTPAPEQGEQPGGPEAEGKG